MHEPTIDLAEAAITREILGAFFDSYNTVGYGFLEATCARALLVELRERQLAVQLEAAVDVTYKGIRLAQHRLDMLVEGKVIVEVKAGSTIPVAGPRQLRNYLRAAGLGVGLLLNYGPKPQFVREYVRCGSGGNNRSVR